MVNVYSCYLFFIITMQIRRRSNHTGIKMEKLYVDIFQTAITRFLRLYLIKLNKGLKNGKPTKKNQRNWQSKRDVSTRVSLLPLL